MCQTFRVIIDTRGNACRLFRDNFSHFLFPKKAVRVTTIMKRLRVPEHSEARSTAPSAEVPADPSAPQASNDPSAPSSAAVPEAAPSPNKEQPTGEEKSQQAPPAESTGEASSEELNPEPQAAEPTSRCNGEASALLHTAAEAMDEQG